MTDHNPLPRCPYCGNEMKKQVLSDYKTLCFWLCPKCSATSPSAGTEESAYAAAMNRWQEPNRVLTRDELQKRIEQGVDVAPLWMEFGKVPSASRWMVTNAPDEAFVNDTVKNLLVVSGYGCNGIWRCWLRKPTAEEMATTPWERKRRTKNEEHE